MRTYDRSLPTALEQRIERLREAAGADPRLEGVLLYGSWTLGEADAHSDLDAYVFVADEHADDFDGREFVSRLAPVRLAHTNLFGILAVVFDDLMRGEFHFDPAGRAIGEIASWRGMVHLPDPGAAVLLDRTGRLTEAVRPLAEFVAPVPALTAEQLTGELANWTLMAAHVLARGETTRAHNALAAMVAPPQLKLLRLLRGSTAHWLTPSRALEADLPAADVARYTATTGAAEPEPVREALRESWAWSRELSREAAGRWGFEIPEDLHEDLAELIG
ncbi:nucleotidyltransferase domain-containing protein [Nocardiopsis ganjiahuensis]|uniref:nucleotidyltransferase domain-containing protein n=1 Tax=Nocardiopsis ganjiahuensis TaxID=239984 RepID=UPI00034C0AF0|nr:nucleotidyltransferase domain-containing protein [Nocardiopsis ganjiahuensis]